MSRVAIFPWDHHIDYFLLLTRNLTQRGVAVTFIVNTDDGVRTCCQNQLDFVFAGGLNRYWGILERIERWWRYIDTNNREDIEYGGCHLRSLCEYERLVAGDALQQDAADEYVKQAAAAVALFSAIISNLSIDTFVVWNGMCLPTKAYAETAKQAGIKVFYAERGFSPETLVLDDMGINYGSTPARSWNAIERLLAVSKPEVEKTITYFSEVHDHARSIVGTTEKIHPGDLRSHLGIPQGVTTILYVAQIDSDTNIIYYSPTYKSNRDLIARLSTIISQFNNTCFLVKLHPEDVNRKAEFEPLLSDNSIIINDVNIQSLLQIVDIIVVRNSTVGLEALTYYKPVVVLGEAIYSYKGFTYDVADEQQLQAVLSSLIKNPNLTEASRYAINRFLFYLFKHYLYFFDGNEVYEGSNREIENRLLEKTHLGVVQHIQHESIWRFLRERILNRLQRRLQKSRQVEVPLGTGEIVYIIYNSELPHSFILKQLRALLGKTIPITVVGNASLQETQLPCTTFYPFNIPNLLRCMFKPYSVLFFSSFHCLKPSVIMYLWLCRAKQKHLLSPFNIGDIFFNKNAPLND